MAADPRRRGALGAAPLHDQTAAPGRLHRDDPDAKTNVDALYGLGGRVMSRFVENARLGEARQRRDLDRAPRGVAAGSDLDVGDRVVVAAVHGATVEVVPATAVTGAADERTSHDG